MPGAEIKADLWLSEFITPWDVYQHGVSEILVSRKTQHQDLLIVKSGAYGKALVLDGKWQSCTGDEFLYHEPLVHPGMLLQKSPRNILVLGGGEGATLRELLRWKTVERIVMVDIDGEVVEACREYLPEMHQGAFDDPRVELCIGDALEFLEDADGGWDFVISDLSDPTEDGPSFKLFTKEFFQRVKRILEPGGLFVLQAGPVSPVEMALHVRLVNTVAAVFGHVRSYSSYVPTFAGPWGFCLASDAPIDHRPEPDEIDRLLAEQTSGGFRFLDGEAFLGLMQTPAHIRKAIAEETRVYTLEEPPRFFGAGYQGE